MMRLNSLQQALFQGGLLLKKLILKKNGAVKQIIADL